MKIKDIYSVNGNDIYISEITDEISENLVDDIVDFYDQNWLGCSDFMHIPDKPTVADNIEINKVYLATFNGNIVGAATLKRVSSTVSWYKGNGKPFYNLTGLLTGMKNKDMNITGLGIELYKTMIEDALKCYSEDVDIIAEIDCRNKNSMRAFAKACEELNLCSAIVGMYTCKDSAGVLTEAPTFIVRVMRNIELGNKIDGIDYTSVAYEYSKTKNEVGINNNLLSLLINLQSSNWQVILPNSQGEIDAGIMYYTLLTPVFYTGNVTIDNKVEETDITQVKLRKQLIKRMDNYE